MARKKKSNLSNDAGQHLALSAAADLARIQLLADPARLSGRESGYILDALGTALPRVAPLYALDPRTGERCELTQEELKGATAKQRASVLLLADGRRLHGVSIKRNDLRQAIAILRALGPAELGIPSPDNRPPPEPASPMSARSERLHERLREIEALLDVPFAPAQLEQAKTLAIALARQASAGRVANLAMLLIDAIVRAGKGVKHEAVPATLAQLRAALDEDCPEDGQWPSVPSAVDTAVSPG